MMKLSRHLCLVALVAMLFVLAAAPAAAVDGVLEINQACAAVGCFPGDSAGFPVEITNPGSYRLTGNLAVADVNTTAIQVSADGVTIDLNGFEIAGPTVCDHVTLVCSPVASGNSGSGIDSGLAHGTAVSNGTVRGMGRYGVSLNRGRARNLRITECAAGGFSDLWGQIRDSRAEYNGGTGIGASLSINNTAERNGGHGILVQWGLAQGNFSRYNTLYGLNFVATGAAYLNNVAYDNNGGNANPQVNGGIEVGTNICGLNTTCP